MAAAPRASRFSKRSRRRNRSTEDRHLLRQSFGRRGAVRMSDRLIRFLQTGQVMTSAPQQQEVTKAVNTSTFYFCKLFKKRPGSPFYRLLLSSAHRKSEEPPPKPKPARERDRLRSPLPIAHTVESHVPQADRAVALSLPRGTRRHSLGIAAKGNATRILIASARRFCAQQLGDQ